MRPFQIVIFAIFGVLALVGLFLFANYSGYGGGQRVIGAVTIWGTLPGDDMQQTIGELIKSKKEFGSVRYVEKDAQTFETTLAEAIASGAGPDLILISQEQLLAQKNKLSVIPYASLPERKYKDSYLPIFELFLNEEGTYGIPFLLDPLVMYYNRPMLASVGVAQPPTTWEAVTGMSALLTRKLSDQTVTKSLIAIGEYDNVTNARAMVSLLLLQSGTTITRNTSNGYRASLIATSANGFGISPAESAMNFYTQFANPSKTVYSWNRAMPESRQAFLAGDVALYPGFASEQRLLKAGNPNLEFDMATIPQPQTSELRTTYGVAYVFALPKASKNSSGAFEAAMALSDTSMNAKAARNLSMAPAHRSLLKPQADDLYEPVFYPEALTARGWLSPAPSITDTILGTMIGNITTGRKSVRDALFTADQALDAAI